MADTNGNAPAHPTVDANRAADYGTYGLTKREYFAGLAMQAMNLANGDNYSVDDVRMRLPEKHAARHAKAAVRYADALLAELENPK